MRSPTDLPFLERAVYRARRVQDAGRLLPILGLILFMLPILWASGRVGSTVRSGIYLFSAWAVLVIGAAVLARLLVRGDAAQENHDRNRATSRADD